MSDGSEYGECANCGNVTYRKMGLAERGAFEVKEARAQDEESANIYKNYTQRVRDDIARPVAKQTITITCPYCHSTNVEKITLGKKVRKGFFWGVAAASTLTKEWIVKTARVTSERVMIIYADRRTCHGDPRMYRNQTQHPTLY